MKAKSITYTKNHLSAVVREVQEGASYLVCDRGQPVAVLAPVRSSGMPAGSGLAELEKNGVVRRGRGKLNVDFFSAELSAPVDGSSVVEALLLERGENR